MASVKLRKVFVVAGLVLGTLGIAFLVLRKPVKRLLVRELTAEYRAKEGSGSGGAVELLEVARGFAQPVDVQFVPGQGGLAVVLEKAGAAKLVDLSKANEEAPPVARPTSTILQVAVQTASETGLLGLAFHPDYAENGRFFANYNPAAGSLRTVVSEWHLPSTELGRRPAEQRQVILELDQPYENHNAGQLAFGFDGYLYVGFGDGGWADDPHEHGQDLATWHGAMLRIDVDSGDPYAVPKDNPFVGRDDARPEIWAYGLRNPWRYAFDPAGRLIVGDVGQNHFEEIDLVRAGDNLGWSHREGRHCFDPKQGCATEGLVEPIFEYGREHGISVTGGVVYTGSLVPQLSGRYLFADFAYGNVWALDVPKDAPRSVPATLLGQWSILVSAFGRDETGEVYLADFGEGVIYGLRNRPGG